MRYALFDLDHTLLPHDTQPLFCNFVLKRERWRVLLHFVFLPVALLRALKIVPLTTAKRAFMAYLWKMPRERLERYAREFAEHEVKPRAYPELLSEIRHHRAEGRVLVLNTASPDIYAPAISAALGFDHCVATPVVIEDPMPLMPEMSGPNNKNEQKIPNMRQQVPGLADISEADRAECWSYSDSPADIPLLDFSGHRALVHPSTSLAARFPDATILRPARPYSGKAGDMLSVVRQFLGLY
jgi:phosphoserine phosphatase